MTDNRFEIAAERHIAEIREADLVNQINQQTRINVEEKIATQNTTEGADPDAVIGENANHLCNEFLDFMASKGYPGSRELSIYPREDGRTLIGLLFNRKNSRNKLIWSGSGYAIGRFGVYGAVLCTDGLIRRQYSGGKVASAPINLRTGEWESVTPGYESTRELFETLDKGSRITTEHIFTQQSLEQVLTDLAVKFGTK